MSKYPPLIITFDPNYVDDREQLWLEVDAHTRKYFENRPRFGMVIRSVALAVAKYDCYGAPCDWECTPKAEWDERITNHILPWAEFSLEWSESHAMKQIRFYRNGGYPEFRITMPEP